MKYTLFLNGIIVDNMLLVRAHPDYWAFYINKLACYQIGVTLYVQRALESASLPQK